MQGAWTGLTHSFSFTLMHAAKIKKRKCQKNSLENFSSFIAIKVDTESRYEVCVREGEGEGGVITPAQFDKRRS